MDIAKSIFTKSSHDGYSTKGDTHADTLSEDDEEVGISDGQAYSNEEVTPIPGGPFSALISSMWPQEILIKLRNNQNEDPNEQPDYQFDEFGFRVEEEDGPEQNSNKLLSIPFIEDPQHKLKWLAHLEFSHNKEVGNLTWDKVETQLVKTEKLRTLLKEGVPHSIRPQVWIRLSGALQKKISADISYKDVMKASDNDKMVASKQIEKELLRILPSNACYSHSHSIGVPKLRRLLRGIAWLYPDIGYCQGIGVIAASLLLFLEEDSAFWMLGTIIEDLLPASYFSSTLIGVQADQKVLGTLISHYLPDLDNVLKEHEIELSLITLQWFLTLFAPVLHMKILLRIWDILFCEGSGVLFQITLGMLKIKEPELVKLENSAQIFNALSNLPQEITDVDKLLEESFQLCSSLNDMTIDTNRRRHLAYIMADQGAFIPNPELGTNLPKQHINKRHLKRSRSVIQTLFFGDDEMGNDMKSKNIRQTELLVDLREGILKIARHFQITDSRYNNIEILPDYSMESHAKDHELFAKVCGTRRRRAKALLDFERHDDDELGFRKNDIITLVSQRDEHCWVGELNGLRGWFPAKFVEILDERSKQYSSAGDDAVSEAIMDLVRGTFCPAFKQILEHGMKKYAILGGICHPWLFIEESANYEVEKDFNSVYSRLVLCKTFRLDEDGKVLTPEELLYRCVQAVNHSHDSVHAQMDVKLRSLVCMGLNEQVLHLWLEVLCSCTPIVQKWYHPWSFINSPGWVQIKCELRILSRFSFNLRADYELPPRPKPPETLKEGVRDMLVKHHLFSWDL